MVFFNKKSKFIVSLRVHFRKDTVRPDVDLRSVTELDPEIKFDPSEPATYSKLLWPVRSTATTLLLNIGAELKPLSQVSVTDLKAALHAQRKQLKVPSYIDLNNIAIKFEGFYLEHFAAADFDRFVDYIGEALFGPVEIKNIWMPSTIVKDQKGRIPDGRRLLKAEYMECFEFLCDFYGGVLIDNSQSGHLHWRQDLRNIFNGCVTRRLKIPCCGYYINPLFYEKEIFESKNVVHPWKLVIHVIVLTSARTPFKRSDILNRLGVLLKWWGSYRGGGPR